MTDATDNKFRPKTLEDFIGHKDLIEKIRIAIDSAQKTGAAFPHVLLTSGAGGTGKTSVANLIAKTLGRNCEQITATGLETIGDLISIVIGMGTNEILFIDEIHGISGKKMEEHLYTVLEDNKITIKKGECQKSKVVTIPVKKFTIIGATTKVGKLSQPFTSRFSILHNLDFYSTDDIYQILLKNKGKIGATIQDDVCLKGIATRSRGIPRNGLRLLDRTKDYAISKFNGVISKDVVGKAMRLERIDSNGLTPDDYEYLNALYTKFACKPCGVAAIASSINTDKRNLEDNVEPFLLRSGYATRLLRGRSITPKGIEALSTYKKEFSIEE